VRVFFVFVITFWDSKIALIFYNVFLIGKSKKISKASGKTNDKKNKIYTQNKFLKKLILFLNVTLKIKTVER